jgi:hypothetical protein
VCLHKTQLKGVNDSAERSDTHQNVCITVAPKFADLWLNTPEQSVVRGQKMSSGESSSVRICCGTTEISINCSRSENLTSCSLWHLKGIVSRFQHKGARLVTMGHYKPVILSNFDIMVCYLVA